MLRGIVCVQRRAAEFWPNRQCRLASVPAPVCRHRRVIIMPWFDTLNLSGGRGGHRRFTHLESWHPRRNPTKTFVLVRTKYILVCTSTKTSKLYVHGMYYVRVQDFSTGMYSVCTLRIYQWKYAGDRTVFSWYDVLAGDRTVFRGMM